LDYQMPLAPNQAGEAAVNIARGGRFHSNRLTRGPDTGCLTAALATPVIWSEAAKRKENDNEEFFWADPWASESGAPFAQEG
jgi:hypothetical protein